MANPKSMTLGIIGLGRMGSNMAKRLMKQGHACVVYDRNAGARAELAKLGAQDASSAKDLVDRLPAGGPRIVWVMLPSGEITESTVQEIAGYLKAGDVIIDGGNSKYKDDMRRAAELRGRGIRYMDVGTSGGVWGAERGYCLMIGGEKAAYEHVEPILRSLAPGADETETKDKKPTTADQGYIYCGPAGSGHFVKMVHNGIEYGMMQAFAEGFDLMHNIAPFDPDQPDHALPLDQIAQAWRRGSVVSSWLLDLLARALAQDPGLEKFEGRVADSGEGRWALEAAIESAVPSPVLSASLFARFRSREEHLFGDKLLSALRNQFGGHAEAPMEKNGPARSR